MHVAQFSHSFVLGPHIEIMKARLPHRHRLRFPEDSLASLRRLRTTRCANRSFTLCITGRRVPYLRLTDEQVRVPRHDHAAQHHKTMHLAHLFENLQKPRGRIATEVESYRLGQATTAPVQPANPLETIRSCPGQIALVFL